ncbi:MAG: SOS response-associated peptidase [Pseudomonadota bacterium]
MCGRYALTTPATAVREHFDVVVDDTGGEWPERLDIRPTQGVPVVWSDAGARRLTEMRWGFLPHWYKAPGDGPLIINARAETVAEKPAFRKAVRERRCLLPANGFYEWQAIEGQRKKRVHWLSPPGEALFAFAGIWRGWGEEGLPTVAIVTCAAPEALVPIHARVPVVVGPADYALWLGEAGHGAAVLMRPEDGFFEVTPDRGPGAAPALL